MISKQFRSFRARGLFPQLPLTRGNPSVSNSDPRSIDDGLQHSILSGRPDVLYMLIFVPISFFLRFPIQESATYEIMNRYQAVLGFLCTYLDYRCSCSRTQEVIFVSVFDIMN